MATKSSAGTGSKFTGRTKVREHFKKANDKTKRVLEAVQKNVSSNVEVLNTLTDGLLAEDSEHSLHDCVTDWCAASVACWGNAIDLFHEVVKTCLPEKDPSSP